MKQIKFVLFLLSGIILSGVFNFFIIERILIPDPCAFHNEDISLNWVFDLFYYSSASTGYHPEASILNLILTLIAGIVIGLLLFSFFNRKSVKQ